MNVIYIPLRMLFTAFIAAFTVVLTIAQAVSDILKIVIQNILVVSLNVFYSILEKLEHPSSQIRDFDIVDAEIVLDRAEERLRGNTLEAEFQTSQSN
jgi:hypothetical protein